MRPGFGVPPAETNGTSTRRGVGSQQSRPQSRVQVGGPLAPAAGTTYPAEWLGLGIQLVHALADRGLADLGRPCDGPNPAMAQDPRLGTQQ
ncbi:hypothetical protein TR51_16290 [Kitasatospora griseola]|uniref:Uncharacterized protein n=1 Tax=Kitasatospora griseola TaxID=2064 RepID=A0A0D0Q3A6_KITGR|nr:hypothetical protein TR51_16290 [Kitasatospora griseola]